VHDRSEDPHVTLRPVSIRLKTERRSLGSRQLEVNWELEGAVVQMPYYGAREEQLRFEYLLRLAWSGVVALLLTPVVVHSVFVAFGTTASGASHGACRGSRPGSTSPRSGSPLQPHRRHTAASPSP